MSFISRACHCSGWKFSWKVLFCGFQHGRPSPTEKASMMRIVKASKEYLGFGVWNQHTVAQRQSSKKTRHTETTIRGTAATVTSPNSAAGLDSSKPAKAMSRRSEEQAKIASGHTHFSRSRYDTGLSQRLQQGLGTNWL